MESVIFRKLETDDVSALQSLRQLYGKVFGEALPSVDSDYLNNLLTNTNVVFFVAEQKNQVVGGATAYVLPSLYGAYNELYLYDVAIARDYQRQGIGSKLLEFIKGHAKQREVKTLFVQADAVDTHARSYYLKNGGVEADVRHYDFNV